MWMLHRQPNRSLRGPAVCRRCALRQKLNLTKEEFAARFGLPLGTIHT
jgi:DNA-binding transcriptional regulator YiaG